MNWSAPQRPVEYAEQALITSILDGTYYAGSSLPGERDLAAQLGITRPTLREALRRLERDGWVTIHQGKSSQVNDIWRDGGLNILSGIVQHSQYLPPNFILNLLQVRLVMAPAFTRAAVEYAPDQVVALLADHGDLSDAPESYARFDWVLQHGLTVASGNPIYTLIFNGFAGFYEQAARLYFAQPEARAVSCRFYAALGDAAQRADANAAETITRETMHESIRLWSSVNGEMR